LEDPTNKEVKEEKLKEGGPVELRSRDLRFTYHAKPVYELHISPVDIISLYLV